MSRPWLPATTSLLQKNLSKISLICRPIPWSITGVSKPYISNNEFKHYSLGIGWTISAND